jgi:hypothetical protein
MLEGDSMFIHASLPLVLLDDLVSAMMGGDADGIGSSGAAGIGVGSIRSLSSRAAEPREIARETLTTVAQREIVQPAIVGAARRLAEEAVRGRLVCRPRSARSQMQISERDDRRSQLTVRVIFLRVFARVPVHIARARA